MVFICPHCRAGYFFFLDKKGGKKSRKQRCFSAHGPAPGSPFFSGRRLFQGYWQFGVIEDLDGVCAFGFIVDVLPLVLKQNEAMPSSSRDHELH